MKWGQWAATRADIFPPDLCTELAHLQASQPGREDAEHVVTCWPYLTRQQTELCNDLCGVLGLRGCQQPLDACPLA